MVGVSVKEKPDSSSISGIVSELMGQGVGIVDIVNILRKRDKYILEFQINGNLTYWRGGWGMEEPVYYSLFNQGQFIKDQRVCWESMQNMMDECHREPKPIYN